MMRPLLSLLVGLLALSASLWLLSGEESCSGGLALPASGAPASLP